METERQTVRALARIHQVIGQWVARRPQAVALCASKLELTYSQLDAAVAAAALRLRALGVRAGDRVVVVGENCVSLCVILLAASSLDAWMVVVNARLSAREVDSIIAHSGARRVLYAPIESDGPVSHLSRHGAQVQDWAGIGAIGVGHLNACAVPEPVSADPAEQVAVLIYTSGTSGRPKGVMLTHKNLLHTAEMAFEYRRLAPGDRVYGVLPMAHIVGLSSQILGTLACGATLVVEGRFSPGKLAAELNSAGITVLYGVPALYAKLVDWARKGGMDFAHHRLKCAVVAGAPLTAQLKQDVEDILGVTLQNGYGLTEMAPTVASTLIDSPRRDCSVGMPVTGVEVRVVDGAGRPVPMGATGELWVRGPNRMKGYYRDEALTREAVDADGWLNTRDLVRMECDGALFIVGRTQELIIRSGFNVYPLEVEQVLNSHPAVLQSAVVGRQVDGNEEVVAFVELAGERPSDEAFNLFLRERLSPYKIPAEIRVLKQLPAGATGKILKSALKEMANRADIEKGTRQAAADGSVAQDRHDPLFRAASR